VSIVRVFVADGVLIEDNLAQLDLNRAWFESGSSRGLGLLCPVPI
jgi:hypothetical protein